MGDPLHDRVAAATLPEEDIVGILLEQHARIRELFEEVRGKGLLLGVKLKVEPRGFVQHLRDRHRLLTVAAGDHTLRILPPLVVGGAEIEEFFDKLSAGASDYPMPEAA